MSSEKGGKALSIDYQNGVILLNKTNLKACLWKLED